MHEERQQVETEHRTVLQEAEKKARNSATEATKLRVENSKLSAQMSQVDTRSKSVSQELSRFAAENKALREKLEQHEVAKNTRDSADKAEQANYKQQVASLYTTMRGLQSQLDQTKRLLGTMQQQREMAKKENEQLKRELAEFYDNDGRASPSEETWEM